MIYYQKTFCNCMSLLKKCLLPILKNEMQQNAGVIVYSMIVRFLAINHLY